MTGGKFPTRQWCRRLILQRKGATASLTSLVPMAQAGIAVSKAIPKVRGIRLMVRSSLKPRNCLIMLALSTETNTKVLKNLPILRIERNQPP